MRIGFSAINFERPIGDIIQKIAIMGNQDYRAFIIDQIILKPIDGLSVQMVGRLIHQEKIRLGQ